MLTHSLKRTPLTLLTSRRFTILGVAPATSTSLVGALLLLVLVPALALLVTTSPAGAIPSVAGSAASQSPDPTGTSNAVMVNGVMTDLVKTFYEDGTWDITKPDGTVVGFGEYLWDLMTSSLFYCNERSDGGGGHCGEFNWNEEEMRWDRVWSTHPRSPEVALYPIDFP